MTDEKSIVPNTKTILEKAREYARDKVSERSIKQVNEVLVAREAFAKTLSEIDAVIAGLEAGDELALEKAARMAQWIKKVKGAIGKTEMIPVNSGYINPLQANIMRWESTLKDYEVEF